MSEKSKNNWAIYVIVLLLAILIYCCFFCCKDSSPGDDIVDVTKDKYLSGFVAIKGTTEQPLGVLRIYTRNNSFAPSVIYKHAQENKLKLRQRVYFQIENHNGVSYAKSIQSDPPQDTITGDDTNNGEIFDLISLNLYNFEPNSKSQYHYKGHIISLEVGTFRDSDDTNDYNIVNFQPIDGAGNAVGDSLQFAARVEQKLGLFEDVNFHFDLNNFFQIGLDVGGTIKYYMRYLGHDKCDFHFPDEDVDCLD
jgi:hypothetical protein